ncbi:uncharacterized protein LOC116348815 [Contarinia nasturtii]|uniref:uncharacterized protein LOC116348815 n=1 Tax=Contarinia nasturtii TaxID=265458 RepID=UPI0012D3F279|nr:uncharacterized protein LOC116348815 [Contarinia nasturtii]
MTQLLKKLGFLYDSYILFILTIGYILGELGHYLIGVTSKQTAIDLDYGDHACQQNVTSLTRHELPVQCSTVMNETECVALNLDGINYCEWNYNGLGLDYQLLAGPSFILVFTIMGVFLGIAADKYNRVRMLSVCTLVFAVAIILQGSVKNYWQLIVLRMIMAAGESGCNPLATGIMSDVFPEKKRALVMAIFNWGIYGGYGIAFPVGRYITKLNIWDLSWRICYYGTGALAVIVAVFTGTTLKEPERKAIGEDQTNANGRKKVSLYKVLTQPRIILLAIAASIRHCGGMTFAYNADLYYSIYFPDVDLGWWLFAVTIGIGSIGVVVGGVVSDVFVAKMGIKSRVAVLAISQLISTPGAFGSVYFEPVWAMITLGISYFFAEMWFGIVFAVLVEIVPFQVRSTTVGIFLFVMNNIGGNLPILVDPVAKYLGYRESIMIFYAGFYLLSSVLFFITMFVMEPSSDDDSTNQQQPAPRVIYEGHDNKVFVGDGLPQPQFTHPQSNGSTNQYYPNGNTHTNKDIQPSYRVIENSRL